MDKTRPIFAIFEPIILFNAMDGEPFRAALMLTISSGSEVANAITVIPIINLGNLNFNEIETGILLLKLFYEFEYYLSQHLFITHLRLVGVGKGLPQLFERTTIKLCL